MSKEDKDCYSLICLILFLPHLYYKVNDSIAQMPDELAAFEHWVHIIIWTQMRGLDWSVHACCHTVLIAKLSVSNYLNPNQIPCSSSTSRYIFNKNRSDRHDTDISHTYLLKLFIITTCKLITHKMNWNIGRLGLWCLIIYQEECVLYLLI